MSLSLSIIIPTKNRRDSLTDCVKSILRQSHMPDEIIIVDQAYPRDSIEMIIKSLTEDRIPIIYIYDNKIRGAAHARNIGIDHSRGDLLFFLDDDSVLLENAILNIVDFYRNDIKNEIAAIGATTINERVCFKDYLVNFIFSHGPFRPAFHRSYYYYNLHKIDVPLFYCRKIGGCVCYRRSIFKQFKFDDAYCGNSYGEDYILSFRVSEKFKTFFSPLVKIEHDRFNKYRKSKELIQQYEIFLDFFLFYSFVKKSFLNIICYLIIVIRDLFKLFFNFYNRNTIKRMLYVYFIIIRVIIKNLSLEQGVACVLQ